jgi:tetratricopeptide (TPR) repeat protein
MYCGAFGPGGAICQPRNLAQYIARPADGDQSDPRATAARSDAVQPITGRSSRRKATVLAMGAIGLAGALTAAAFVAPSRTVAAAPIYRPTDPAQVIATVPARDPKDVATRQALIAAPERVELAVELARGDIERYRERSDPRFLGRAQATLARWWKLAEPPPEVLLLRATIEQAIHQFTEARADLDQLIKLRPRDAQAHLTRAVVATVTADYQAARASCRAVAPLSNALVAATCEAPLDGLAGHADDAYHRLHALVGAGRRDPRDATRGGVNAPAPPAQRGREGPLLIDPAVRGWALTALAELADMRGDSDAAAAHARDALALDPDDAYARNLLADLQMATGHAAEASALLAGRDQVDSHLLRRAIAEHALHGPDAARLAAAMRERIAAAADRGDRIHLREEARFALAVELDAPRAVRIARDNWRVQKELADARLLAEAAVAARDRDAAAPVIAWAQTTGVRDVALARALAQLEGMR